MQKISVSIRSVSKRRNKFFYLIKALKNKRELDRLFFGVEIKNIEINVYGEKKDFSKAIGEKQAPNWLIAFVKKDSCNKIYIFDNNKKPTKSIIIEQILMHELTHLYVNSLNKRIPEWLKEGVAVHVARQIFRQNIKEISWDIITKNKIPFKKIHWNIAVKHNGYEIAGLIVWFFIHKIGWREFVNTIKKIKKNTDIFNLFAGLLKMSKEDIVDECRKMQQKKDNNSCP